jgi:hypothetical protein
MRARRIIVITTVVWLIACCLYAYYWVTSILAQPDNYGYERWVIFPLFGFLVYRLPFLLAGLIVLIFVELMLSEMRHRES